MGDEHRPVRGWRCGLCGKRSVAARVDEWDGAGGQFSNEGHIALVFIAVGNVPVHICWSGCARNCYGRVLSFLGHTCTARCSVLKMEETGMLFPFLMCPRMITIFHLFMY